MKLKTNIIAAGVVVDLFTCNSATSAYAGQDIRYVTSVNSKRQLEAETSSMIGPTFEQVMYYINYYYPYVYNFLSRYVQNPSAIPLTEKIRILKQYWNIFVNSFKPIDAYSVTQEY